MLLAGLVEVVVVEIAVVGIAVVVVEIVASPTGMIEMASSAGSGELMLPLDGETDIPVEAALAGHNKVDHVVLGGCLHCFGDLFCLWCSSCLFYCRDFFGIFLFAGIFDFLRSFFVSGTFIRDTILVTFLRALMLL